MYSFLLLLSCDCGPLSRGCGPYSRDCGPMREHLPVLSTHVCLLHPAAAVPYPATAVPYPATATNKHMVRVMQKHRGIHVSSRCTRNTENALLFSSPSTHCIHPGKTGPPIFPMFLDHCSVPRFLEPRPIISLGRGKARSNARHAVEHLEAAFSPLGASCT